MIKVARYRNTPYIVNFTSNGGMKTYQWVGSKNNKIDVKSVPEELVDYLLMNSVCFKDGELVIIEEDEKSKEIIDNIDDKEEYKNNTNSREEIEKLLTGNFNKMKSRLDKITNIQEKNFIVDVAKEINIDSSAKQKWLAEWIGAPVDIVFDEE